MFRKLVHYTRGIVFHSCKLPNGIELVAGPRLSMAACTYWIIVLFFLLVLLSPSKIFYAMVKYRDVLVNGACAGAKPFELLSNMRKKTREMNRALGNSE